MKTKSSYHRSTNTYKFQTFSERISHINIDVVRKGGRIEQQPDDADSFFAAALAKWRDLNCTQDFGNFTSEITGQVDSYAQLVHYEDEIITALKKHLKERGSLAHQPLLDLVVQLSRDLQTDFYPHFEDFFLIIVSLLNTQDTDLLESAFRAFGYLFKFLWRYLVKDIEDVFRLYSPLLGSHQRDHIRNFAAESFAFLMRKSKDHNALFNMMLASLDDDPNLTKGLGRLFFEMIKGVKKQFHSSTEKVLPVLLSKLGPIQPAVDQSCPLQWQRVLETLEAAFEFMANWTSPEHAGVVCNVLKSCVTKMYDLLAPEPNNVRKGQIADQLRGLLTLTNQWVGHHGGYLIQRPDSYGMVIMKLLEGGIIEAYCAESVLELTATLLNTTQCDLANETISRLVNAVFSGDFSPLQVLDFSCRLFSMHSFEKDVLHVLLHFCHVHIGPKSPPYQHAILFTLCSLVRDKQTHITDGSLLERHSPYIVDFSLDVYRSQSKAKKSKKSTSSVPEFLLSLLEFNPTLLDQDNVMSALWAALVCLPSVRPIDMSVATKMLRRLVKALWKAANQQEEETTKDTLLFLLSQTVCALMQCGRGEPTQSLMDEDVVWEILRTYPASAHVLLMVDLYVTCLAGEGRKDALTADHLQLIFAALQPNLSSPFKRVRMLTLRILSQFSVQLPNIPDLPTQQVCVFKLCLEAEFVPATVEDYREKQKRLNRLSFDAVQPNVPVGEYKEVALRYLIGCLYVNFQLLWQPIMELIKSHACGMDKKRFWAIYVDHLQNVASVLEFEKHTRETSSNLSREESLERKSSNSCDLSDLFRKDLTANYEERDRPDYWNVRLLLWRTMALFADRAEGRSREIVPLVFRFIENEYYPSNINNAATQDIRARKGQDISMDGTITDGEMGENSLVEEVEEEDEEEQTPRRKKGKKKVKGSVYRALTTHLQLFSQFKDPKSLYKELQLRRFYMQLLSSKFPDIQKVVLACLMTYNDPFLMPYRVNLEALMEDKKFREALVQFSIDETTGIVATNHREGLMPVLMRILYGKMLSKTGSGTQGKSGGTVRRATILRFIAGCSAPEIGVFLDLVLDPCKHIVKDDCNLMMADFLKSLSPSAVIPLKKQQSILDTIGVIFSKLGHRITKFATMIIHLVTTLLASYAQLLDQRNQIEMYAVGQLKKLRQLALLRLVEFFGIFDEHPLSPNDIDCIFDAAIWPQISSLDNECLASPTPLLKLIHVWSKNFRSHPLLAKHHPTDRTCTILPTVTALLSAPTVNASVVAMVMEIVENLLMEEGSEIEDRHRVGVLEVNNLVDVHIESQQSPEKASFGTKVLFPHVPAILQYLSSSVSRHTQDKADRTSLPMKELNILSKISLHVSDPEQSSMLVSLLLPFLRRTNEKHETTELDILHTVRNVITLCRNPTEFLSPLSCLFYRLSFRQSRSALCDIFTAMSKSTPAMDEVSRLMRQMNSWDPNRVDEPDYGCRLAGFKQANERLAAMTTVDVAFVTPVVYNCFYMILKIDDMSMRDNSTHFLKALLQKLASEPPNTEHFNTIVIHKYASAIKDALRLKSESARHEMIGILADIVRLFPEHPRFQCMRVLFDEDVEKDFFENIRHIQYHRRMRALRRLALHAKQGELTYSALYQFLLPMATAIIFDRALAAKNPNLIIEAIDAVGAIVGQLPWRWYYQILQQYLRLLMHSIEQQKTAVRLVVAVLDAFHFDLSLSEGVESVQVGKTSTKPTNLPSKVTEGTTNGETDEIDDTEDVEEKDQAGANDINDSDHEETAEQDTKDVAVATKIHRIIVASILPKLHKTLTKKAKSEGHHKKVRYNIAEDDEVLRVPIALATVKLLQALPGHTLQQALPGILAKVCQMLKSRAKDVRDVSRDTLIKILASLGVGYFSFILKELRHALTRGYQLHVLSFTVHGLLQNILPSLKPGDLDTSVDSIIEVINKELFGDVADEKEVEGIVVKLPEARSIKGYDSYEMLAKILGEKALTRLLLPLKEILETSHSHKVVRKASDVLKHVTMGLTANEGIAVDAMLIYIHGLVTESIPSLSVNESVKFAARPQPDPKKTPVSCYLLPAEPKRGGVAPKVSRKTNMHLIVEFGLQLLYMNLKRSKLSPSNQQHLQMLDPFVQILLDSLTSKHTKLTIVALRSITWVMRYPLPSVNENAATLTKKLFNILHNYATAGAAKGANFDLVVCCFKAVTVLVRDVKKHTINDKQLQVLLEYAEEDIHDHTRQATAFGLLKAILSRKLIVPEMHDVMRKVSQLSITSENPSVRLQSRQVVLNFLMDYPLGKQLKRHLEFYVSQLNFELETGRESALEMLTTIFSSFPQKILETYAGMFFVPMAARLINDESAKCRKITGLAIKSLLQKLQADKRNELFTMATQWLHDSKSSHQRLASHLCGIFVDSEESGFQRRLNDLLPQIAEMIRPNTLQKDTIQGVSQSSDAVEEEKLHTDYTLYNLLTALAKILKCCSVLGKNKHTVTMNAIWESVQPHLLHPRPWIRLVSAQLFGDLFAAKQPDQVAEAFCSLQRSAQTSHTTVSKKAPGKTTKRRRLAEDEEGRVEESRERTLEYPLNCGQDVLRELVFTFCMQLQSPLLDKDLGDQVVRNLVFLGKVINRLDPEDTDVRQEISEDDDDDVDDDDVEEDGDSERTEPAAVELETEPCEMKRTNHGTPHRPLADLTWVMRKMCRIAAFEAVKTPKATLKRTCVVKWLAAMSVDIGGEKLQRYLRLMLRPMCREIGSRQPHSDDELRQLCQEALDLIKSLVGLENFSLAYADVQKSIAQTRAERKQKRALQAVADPVQAAKRKEKKQQNKKIAKKRKLQQMRPTYHIGKRTKLD